MATYKITAPDGNEYEIDGPDDAPEIDVINAVLDQYPDSYKPKGTDGGDPLAAAVTGTPAPVQDSRPSQTSAEYTPEGGYTLGGAYGHAEERGGGYGIDPKAKDMLGPVVGNIVDYGVVPFQAAGYGVEALSQGADALSRKYLGEDTEFLPGSGVMALGEALPMGGLEAGMVSPGVGRPRSPEAPAARLSPEVESGWTKALAEGTVEDAMRFAIDNKINVNPEDVVHYITKRDAGEAQPARTVYADQAVKGEGVPVRPEGEVSPVEAKLAEEAQAFQTKRANAAEVDTVDKIVDRINTQIKDWENAPNVEVHNSFDDLDGIDSTALGVTTPEGKVLLNASKIDSPETLNSVLFHEGLGHHGLSLKFSDDLDKTLEGWYNNSKDFRAEVDKWQAANPNAYADATSPIARAADEVLAKMSEGGPLTAGLIDRVKNQIKAVARKAGMRNVDFSEREIRTILAMAHDAVINGKRGDVIGNGFRFMRNDPDLTPAERLGTDEQFVNLNTGEAGPAVTTYDTDAAKALIKERTGVDVSRYSRQPEPEQPRQKFSLAPESIRSVNDLDDLFELASRETEGMTGGPQTVPQILRDAEDFGLTPKNYLRGKNMEESKLAARLAGAKQVLTNLADELEGLADTAREKGMTPTLQANIAQKLATFKAVYSRFDADTSEVGRALRILRETTESRKSEKAAARYMDEAGLDSIAADPEALNRFLTQYKAVKNQQGPAAAARFVKNSSKRLPEDVADSVITGFMLSSPTTWLNNFVGTPLNFLTEMAGKATGSAIGQTVRNSDRITAREVAANIYGPLTAFSNWQMYGDVIEGLMKGTSKSRGAADKMGSSQSLTKIPFTPRKIMAGTDAFWGHLMEASSLQGQGMRKAISEGFTGKELLNKALEYGYNPTDDMRKEAGAFTDRMLFRDKPTTFTQGIADLQRPRLQDELQINLVDDPANPGKQIVESRVSKKADTKTKRGARFTLRQMVKFAPTIDSIARTVIRNSPAYAVTPEFRKALMTPGPTRQAAMGRLSVGLAAATYLWMQAAEGNVTGAGDPNYKKQAASSATRPPFSIKVGDEWISYRGLDPVSGQIAAVATATEKAQEGEPFSASVVGDAALGFAQGLLTSTYAQSLASALQMGKESADMVTAGKGVGPATTNFIAGQAANLATPAGVNWVNQEFVDPAARDTTGDDSLGDRITGRIQSRIPEVPGITEGSKALPQKVDVLGRDLKNARQPFPVDDSPGANEVTRLNEGTDEVFIGPVGPRVKGVRLEAEQVQRYQKLAGTYLLESVNELIKEPEYQEADDDLKREVIKELYAEAKKMAREELFNEETDAEEEEEE